jgi:hypothetical protein
MQEDKAGLSEQTFSKHVLHWLVDEGSLVREGKPKKIVSEEIFLALSSCHCWIHPYKHCGKKCVAESFRSWNEN